MQANEAEFQIPDPRRYAAPSDNALVRLAGSDVQSDAIELHEEMRSLLAAGNDEGVRAALDAAPSAAIYRKLWAATCAVAEGRGRVDADNVLIVARPFAIPVVLVAGARQSLRIPGALPDIAAVHALLERHGAVGSTRNFGLSAALVPLEALERFPPSLVYSWNSAYAGGAPQGLAGAPIEVAPGREQAHLRFLLGAGITPVHLPSFIETAADISRWGTLFTQTLARQLAQAGLELLPLARPPRSLLDAAHHGRRAVLETAFQLFASQAIRTCRMSAGEPTIIVSAHREAGAADMRISVSSMLDDALLEGFCWPLHPADDLQAIITDVAGLLEASRVTDLRFVPEVVTNTEGVSAVAFISARDFDGLAGAAAHH